MACAWAEALAQAENAGVVAEIVAAQVVETAVDQAVAENAVVVLAESAADQEEHVERTDPITKPDVAT